MWTVIQHQKHYGICEFDVAKSDVSEVLDVCLKRLVGLGIQGKDSLSPQGRSSNNSSITWVLKSYTAPAMASILWPLYQALSGLNNGQLTDEIRTVDLAGQWVIITGGNNGVGLEAAKRLSKSGANLILACREPPAWETHPTVAVQQCKSLAEEAGHLSDVEWWEVDIASINSIEAFVRQWLDTGRALDVLCNNAGISPSTKGDLCYTENGFELVHQVSSFAPLFLALTDRSTLYPMFL